MLYPSRSLHRVTEVTRGERLASFFWLQSMIRDDGQRSLLFDLDQSIQAVTQDLGSNHAEVLRLTGCITIYCAAGQAVKRPCEVRSRF